MLFVWIEATQEVVDMPVAAAVLFARGKDDQLLGTLSRIVPLGGLVIRIVYGLQRTSDHALSP